MLDRVLVLIAMLCLALFCGIVVYRVAIPDLTVTIGVILFIAFHDFWVSVLKPGAAQPGTRTDVETRPHPVSGEPLAGPKDDYTPR